MIRDAVRAQVRLRAGDRCEYCGLPQQQSSFAAFHIDHVLPKKHGGDDDPANLALACIHCNLHRGSDIAGVDPVTGEMVPLFNPRTQRWPQHFLLRRSTVKGLTPIGRATVQLLQMNAPDRVELRLALQSSKQRLGRAG